MNVAEKLAREIARVTTLRGHYAELDGTPGVNVKPALMMMDHTLEQAKLASGLDDAEVQLVCLKALEGFEK